MLVIFKCKAAGDIIMFEENAKPLLDVLGRDIDKGIILAAETAEAIAKLEAEVERMKVVEAEEKARREAEAREKELELQQKREAGLVEDEDKDEIDRQDERRKQQREKERKVEPVSFAARAYPLLEMLRRANRKERDVVWGV
ncbi:MAG: hypothetical protein H6R04_2012 [Burkholderiaceae bacterium]|nr:hypothetical protein [Burkholderiaceae bacterium]